MISLSTSTVALHSSRTMRNPLGEHPTAGAAGSGRSWRLRLSPIVYREITKLSLSATMLQLVSSADFKYVVEYSPEYWQDRSTRSSVQNAITAVRRRWCSRQLELLFGTDT